MATTYYTDLQKLYVAYFNRPADTAGLAYYEGVLEAAKTPAALASAMAAISASFAASAEYKAAYANMTNADIVNAVYQNIFGRPAEDAGKKYWADLLDAKKITIDAVVTQVAAGAQGSDAVAFNNKVAASLAFTNALGTTNAYSGDKANVEAKAFLSGVTDNASFASATDPVILSTTVAKVNLIGTPFTLQSGLDARTAAATAKVNFLDALDGKVDGKFVGGTTTTPGTAATAEATVAANVDAATTKVVSLVDAALPAAEQGLYGNTATSATVKAALLTEAKTTLATNLSKAQGTLTTDNSNIAKVAGLNDAIKALATATTAATNAVTADAAAHTDVSLKVAAYNVLNSSAKIAEPAANVYTISGVITTDSKGNLVLATGVTEDTNKGVTALLNSLIAEKAADANVTATAKVQADAQATVDFLDLTDTAKTDLTDIATSMKLATGVTPTAAQITAQLSGLKATSDAAAAASAAYPSDTNLATAATNAKNAYDTFNGLVTKFYADDNANPLIAKLALDTTAAGKAQDAVDALNTALSDLTKANVVQAELNAVNGQVSAVSSLFTANKLELPVDLSATTQYVASVKSDIYVAGTTSTSIANFGILGSDALYIGNKYTLNTSATTAADIATKGNDAAIEAFIVKNGADTQIVLEQKAFASSEANPGADLVTITLTGVDATKVHLNNGIITVS